MRFFAGETSRAAPALSLAFAAAKIKNLPLALVKKIGAWLLGKSIDNGARRSNNWLDRWQSDILGTWGRVKSLTRAFLSSTDVPVLLLNKPIIVQWAMSEFFFQWNKYLCELGGGELNSWLCCIEFRGSQRRYLLSSLHLVIYDSVGNCLPTPPLIQHFALSEN